jgi:hypothetical protein
MGRPSPDDLAAMAAMPRARLEKYKQVLSKYKDGKLEKILAPVKDRVPPSGLLLLRRMLAWNPASRISAACESLSGIFSVLAADRRLGPAMRCGTSTLQSTRRPQTPPRCPHTRPRARARLGVSAVDDAAVDD